MLAHNSAGSATERVPRVYWELTTSRLLTMEYLEGPSVSKYLRMLDANDAEGIEALKAAGFDEDVFCSNIITNFLQDAFHHGVFHADLHPANLLILPNNVVGYVDFGIVAKLTPEARRKQIELTLAYASGVADDIYREFLNICTMTEDTDLEGMRRCIGEMARTWYAQPIVKGRVRFKVSITKGMMDLLDASRAYGTLVDREMIKYIRSSVLVDGLVMRLAPGFDIAGALRDCVESYLVEEAKRKTLSSGGALTMLTDLAVWLQGGPSAMIRALDLFERRQVVFRASISTPRKRQDAGRLRTQATAAGLVVSVVFLTASGGWKSLAAAPFFAYTAGLFVTSWSLWLLFSLRRQHTRRR
jgi:ubiquinone biosynthesis protein